MDEFDHPFADAGEALGPFTILTCILAFAPCLTTCLLSISEMSRLGPDVGEIVAFDPRDGPKHWDQPGIQTRFVPTAVSGQGCILMPSVMVSIGGSFVIEAKQTSRPPVFLVHWSGSRTDTGCGIAVRPRT